MIICFPLQLPAINVDGRQPPQGRPVNLTGNTWPGVPKQTIDLPPAHFMWTQHFLPGHASISEMEIRKNLLLYSNPKISDCVLAAPLIQCGLWERPHWLKKLKSVLATEARHGVVPKNGMSLDLRDVQTCRKILSGFIRTNPVT